MAKRELEDAKLEDVKIIFRNLSGSQTKFNAKGKRNFSVVLTPGMAEAMEKDGWNIKRRPPREEDGDTLLHMKCNVNFDSSRPPAIYLITSRGRTRMTADTVGQLDVADITNVDLILHPYFFDDDSKPSAYVKTMFVTINEDDLEKKYAELDDYGPNGEPSPPWDE